MMKSTLIINRREIESLLTMKEYISIIENAFKMYGKGEVQMPPKSYLYFEKGDLRCMPAYIPSINIAGVKTVNVHPQNKDLPSVMASISLIDPDTGFILAIMDGTYITKMRTGAAGGVAAKYLSRVDSETAAFIGASEQALSQLDALMNIREIKKIFVFDMNEEKKNNFSEYAENIYKTNTEAVSGVREAVINADIVITTTPARTPVIGADFINKGTHINAIGADAKGKQELDPVLLKKAKIIIDNWEQASHSGEINVAYRDGIINRDDIFADIGEVVTGEKKARESEDDITIFDSTGLAIQDISVAGEIYKKIINDKGLSEKVMKVNLC